MRLRKIFSARISLARKQFMLVNSTILPAPHPLLSHLCSPVWRKLGCIKWRGRDEGRKGRKGKHTHKRQCFACIKKIVMSSQLAIKYIIFLKHKMIHRQYYLKFKWLYLLKWVALHSSTLCSKWTNLSNITLHDKLFVMQQI